MATQPVDSALDDSIGALLYLYLWPFWMFEDVSRGNLLEQAAAYRHNREKRGYLPAYILKWTILFALFMGAIDLFETLGKTGVLIWQVAVLLAGVFGMFASWSFVIAIQITVAYVFLCRWRHL
ncbi:hypothetical protein [Chitinimonas sp.]|uniref:hypothetical protein n=1 Tax=Chitinimonas sp. TaxID=1934313 RepID=UPI0035B03D57